MPQEGRSFIICSGFNEGSRVFQAPGGLLLIRINRQNFAKSACKTTKFCNFAKERNLNDEKLMNVHQRIGLF